MKTLINSFRFISIKLILFLSLFAGLSSPAWALFGCVQNSYQCVSSGCKYIDSTNVCTQGSSGPPDALYINSTCWQYNGTYTCYTGQQTNSCSTAQLQGCYQAASTCVKTIHDGNCVQWQANYICPGDATTTCQTGGPIPDPSACSTVNQTCNATDENTCINQTTTQLCPTETTVPQCNSSGNCTLSSATCTDDSNGVCSLQHQTYSCGLSTQVCTQEASVNQCDQNMTEGLGTPQTQNTNNNFQEAATYMGILDAISKDMTPGNLTIFPGKFEQCKDPILSGFISNNCCNINLTGRGGNLIDHCTSAEEELTAARRAHRTYYLGRFCDDRLPLIGICLIHEQGYCEFDSVLAKIIQVQGREQLAQLAASGYAAAQSGNFDFNYFSSNGGWGPQTTVNGNTVVAWQWPTYCKSVNGKVDIQAEEQAEQQGGLVCPSSPSQWFAVCDSGTSCSALPSDPRDGAGTSGWTVQNVDPQQNSSYALDNYTVATGDCSNSTGACTYSLSAWPAGSGGQADLSMNLGWPMYQPGVSQPSANQINQLGNYEFRTVSIAGSPGASMPSTVPFDYSLNDGTSWQQVQLPTNLPIGQEQLGDNIEIFGQCNSGSLQCQYTVKAPVSVNTMPWGSPRGPGDCEGFTTAQLSVLNFNKMNFSQYIATLTPASLNTQQMATNAGADAQSFYSTFNSGGTEKSSSAQSNPAAYICDNYDGVQCQDESASGQGPFGVELNATTTWPPGTGGSAVTGVTVNWGDGTSASASQENGMYVANHTYPSVNSNTTFTAVVTFQTAQGNHTVNIPVTDADTTPPSGSAENSGAGLTNSPVTNYTPSDSPSGNSVNGGPGVPGGAP